jgi:hypothetical protein
MFEGCVRRASGHQANAPPSSLRNEIVQTFLWIAAVILVISGIVTIIKGQVVPGVLLIFLGLIVGPGGVSVVG